MITLCATVALTVNARQIQSDDFLGKTVTIRGSVMAAVRDEIDNRFNWIIVGTPDGDVYTAAEDSRYPIAELRKLTDAEVLLKGVVGRFTSWRRFLGYQLYFSADTETGIDVLEPAPADPFAVPDLDDCSSIHRRKIRGLVTAVTRGQFFLRSGEGQIIRTTPADNSRPPPIGAHVTVSGFPRYGQYTPLLNNSVWRLERTPDGSLEKAEAIDVTSLFVQDGPHRYANNHLCGRIIELSGSVESVPSPNALTPDGFQIDCAGTSVRVDLSGLPEVVRSVPSVGARVKVAGLCYGNFSDTDGSSVFPLLIGFTLIPRTTDDVTILADAPWMTPAVLLGVIGALTVLLALFIVWTTALRIVSVRRARELTREQIRGARAELKVEERTRLAVELHDSISQTLTGVALQIDAAAGTDGDGAKSFLATARNMLASCRQELNGCLWDLRSRTFEEKDMTEAVQRTLAPHVGDAKLTVRFNVPRERLSEQTAHAVLRIIRELGTNAVKHGHARNVKIAGEFHDDTISFSVTDDGRGFDATTAPGPAQGHFGLQGVRERLNAFNGTIRCDSEPGCGAKFTVTLHTTEPEDE